MIDYFIKVVGKENVTEELIDREAYSTDASQIKAWAFCNLHGLWTSEV